jgi:hypothetical protein
MTLYNMLASCYFTLPVSLFLVYIDIERVFDKREREHYRQTEKRRVKVSGFLLSITAIMCSSR